MISYDKFCDSRLPDITIYGGDTTPWSVTLFQQNDQDYPSASLDGSTARLTFIPYAVSMGIGTQANSIPPVLTLTASVEGYADGSGTVLFMPSKADTINLRGKYTYQIEIINGDNLRVKQGTVTIKQNINRV